MKLLKKVLYKIKRKLSLSKQKKFQNQLELKNLAEIFATTTATTAATTTIQKHLECKNLAEILAKAESTVAATIQKHLELKNLAKTVNRRTDCKNDPIEKKYVYIIGRVYENFIRNIGYSVLKLVHQRYD